MKHFSKRTENFFNGILNGAGFLAVVGFAWIASAAFTSLWNVSGGTTVSASLWNQMSANLDDLNARVSAVSSGVPAGAIMAFNWTSCPSGWDLADGTADPAVGGGTNAMDLRGKFLRWSDGWSWNDPDFATRTGGTGTLKIGSTQADEIKTHDHKSVAAWTLSNRVWVYGGTSRAWFADGWDGGYVTSATWGNETRPKNVAVLYCIKQ